MKPRINYRAERADRTRKKAAKKEARLAARSKNPDDTESSEDTVEESSASDNPQPDSNTERPS